MRYFLMALFCVPCLALTFSPKAHDDDSIGSTAATDLFKTNAVNFAPLTTDLHSAIASIDATKPATIQRAQNSLKSCRSGYKKIEFFLEYFFPSNARFYNRAPKIEVEEPFMEWQTPTGLQVIESLLFDDSIRKTDLLEQAEALSSSAHDLTALLYQFTSNDKQLLESVRLEMIRVCTLGITGFDAPMLKSGVEESAVSFAAIQSVLEPYLALHAPHADSVAYFIHSSLDFLRATHDFDSFDRLAFLTNHALPLQQAFGAFVRETGLELNTTGNVLNYDARHLYSPDAINLTAFPQSGIPVTGKMIALGKKLFNETALSGNNKISCATCHQPGKHFTDALPKSIAFNGHSTLRRNAPSLVYAAYQYEQFWDGRTKSLEQQVVDVLTNSEEMNGDARTNISGVSKDQRYTALFSEVFGTQPDSVSAIDKVAISISAFVRTLNYRSSPFDKYIQGNKAMLSPAQICGFNLFMGKAQCGTCHFAPLFNGLLPPLYNITEVEVLGTPRHDNFDKPSSDPDQGRYQMFPIDYYQRAFKTPTVRNVSATGPYMHNGSMKTLEKVLEFYNKGGGRGLGLQVSNQTLSPAPLNLSSQEISEIVRFLCSLEDVIDE